MRTAIIRINDEVVIFFCTNKKYSDRRVKNTAKESYCPHPADIQITIGLKKYNNIERLAAR